MEKSMFIKALKLSHIPRWVIVDMVKSQTVSDHTYRVQIIILQLVDKLKLAVNKPVLIMRTLFHDIEEAETGDMPSPYKNSNSELHNSLDLEESIIRLADTIEAHIWLSRYGVNPSRVRRFLESKIIFLGKEISEFTAMSSTVVNGIINDIIESGIHYD